MARRARPSTNGTGPHGARKRAVVARDLVSELKNLRLALDEMTEHYRLRVGAQITELLQTAEGAGELERNGRRLPAAVMEQLLDVMHTIRLKPQKGRAKDFVRLQELVDELVERLPAER
jgi:hypothetical protein